MSPRTYERTFLARLTPPRPETRLASAFAGDDTIAPGTVMPTQVIERLCDALLRNDKFLFRVADEAGEALFNGDARDRIRSSIAGILVARMSALGDAHASFARVKRELSMPWRIEQGGADGAPTKTSDLVSMGHLLHAEIHTAEDLVTRAVKLALDEEKSRGELAGTDGPLDAARFTGRHETLPVPDDMTAGEREAVRNLLTGFKQYIDRRRAATASGTAEPALLKGPDSSDPAPHSTRSTGAVADPTTSAAPVDRGMASPEGSNLPIPNVHIEPRTSAAVAFEPEAPITRSRGASADEPF